jgi:hypothetical protein
MLTLSGQGSFRSGTIIVNDSTKMNGKISPALSDGIITSCLFRAGNEGNTVTFTPDDLQAWHLDGGRQFISGSYISPETSEMFLEILFDGISDLFYYNDLSAEHYLIAKKVSHQSRMKKQISQASVQCSGYVWLMHLPLQRG